MCVCVCVCVCVCACATAQLIPLSWCLQVHYDEPSMGGLFDFDEIDDDGQDEDDDEADLEDVAAIKG